MSMNKLKFVSTTPMLLLVSQLPLVAQAAVTDTLTGALMHFHLPF